MKLAYGLALLSSMLATQVVAAPAGGAAGTAAPTAPATKGSPGDAAYNEGLALLGTKSYGEAAEKFEAAVTADQKHADAWYQLASARRRSGRCDRAVVAYRRFLALAPDMPAPYYGLGLCLNEAGDRAGATQALKRYIAVANPKDDKKWIEHANSVIAELAASAPAAPTSPPPQATAPAAGEAKPAPASPGTPAYVEAQTLRDHGHVDEAIAKFRQSIAIDPRNILPRVALGELLLKIRRDDEAITALRAAVDKNPTHPLAWYDLAFAYRAKGKMKEAVDAYERYIKLRPTDPDPYYGLARALQQLGRKADARRAFETYVALEKNPNEQRWVESAKTQLQALGTP